MALSFLVRRATFDFMLVEDRQHFQAFFASFIFRLLLICVTAR